MALNKIYEISSSLIILYESTGILELSTHLALLDAAAVAGFANTLPLSATMRLVMMI